MLKSDQEKYLQQRRALQVVLQDKTKEKEKMIRKQALELFIKTLAQK